MPLILDLPPLEQPVLMESYAAEKSGSSKKSSSSKKNKGPHWERDPYVRAAGGGQVFGSNGNTSTAIVVGGEAGFQYEYVQKKWPRWGGTSRVGGSYVVSGENASGMDLRVGTFFGPRGKTVGATIGPDIFYNTWSYGQNTLPEAFGLDVPLTVTANLNNFTAFVGGIGTWTNNEKRARDWDVPMHEAAGFVGLGGTLEGVDVIGRYEYRMTAAGEQQTILLTAKIDGGTIWDLLDQADESQGGSGSGTSGGKKDDDDDSDSGTAGGKKD